MAVKGLRKEKWVAEGPSYRTLASMGPQTHLKVKGESQLHEGVLWLPHAQHGTRTPTHN